MGDTRFDFWNTYLTWFDYWLKGDAEAGKKIKAWAKLRYFAMGENKWRAANSWPVEGSRDLRMYLGSQGAANSLFGDGVLTSSSAKNEPPDIYKYDPENPVQSLGGAMCCTGTADAVAGAQDQRSVESRHDVLVYTSEPLKTGVHATGPAKVTLYVSSSAVDTDFTAKLVDVYPDGRAFNVLESILRARYRDGLNREVWMERNKVYKLTIPLGATSNYFGPGHRIRVEISSSNFPRFDRNLNVGGDNATATTWVTATNQIFHSSEYPSELVLTQKPN
jgi:putative CocE/NonD family hydrolase